jgi:hypothetical protein
MEVPMCRTRNAAVLFAAATFAVTAAMPSPAEAFFFPLLLGLGGPPVAGGKPGKGQTESVRRDNTFKADRQVEARQKARQRFDRRRSGNDGDKLSSRSVGKGTRTAAKAETNAKPGHDARQMPRSHIVEHGTTVSESVNAQWSEFSDVRASADTQAVSPTGVGSNTDALELGPGGIKPGPGSNKRNELLKQPANSPFELGIP